MYNRSGDSRCYRTILYLPHHVSPTRPQMSALNRAAQFAPFDALTGLGSALAETARQTVPRRDLDDSQKIELNQKLQLLLAYERIQPQVTITYFQPDDRKPGGAYLTKTGSLKKVDPINLTLNFEDQTQIPVDHIYQISCECFPDFM